MGMINKFMGGSQVPNLDTRTAITRISITEDGKYKLGKLEVGDVKYKILDAVCQKGMVNIDEIKEITGIDKTVLKHHLVELEAQGYVNFRKTIQ
jgi:transcription initiation factor IIE alpha subunit